MGKITSAMIQTTLHRVMDPLMTGNRKLIAFVIFTASVVGLALSGKVPSMDPEAALQWGLAFFVGGNVGEHGLKKLTGSK